MQKNVNQHYSVVGFFGLLLGLFWLIPVNALGETLEQTLLEAAKTDSDALKKHYLKEAEKKNRGIGGGD